MIGSARRRTFSVSRGQYPPLLRYCYTERFVQTAGRTKPNVSDLIRHYTYMMYTCVCMFVLWVRGEFREWKSLSWRDQILFIEMFSVLQTDSTEGKTRRRSLIDRVDFLGICISIRTRRQIRECRKWFSRIWLKCLCRLIVDL